MQWVKYFQAYNFIEENNKIDTKWSHCLFFLTGLDYRIHTRNVAPWASSIWNYLAIGPVLHMNGYKGLTMQPNRVLKMKYIYIVTKRSYILIISTNNGRSKLSDHKIGAIIWTYPSEHRLMLPSKRGILFIWIWIHWWWILPSQLSSSYSKNISTQNILA